MGTERCRRCGAFRAWGEVVLPEGILVGACGSCGDPAYLERGVEGCGWIGWPGVAGG